MDSLGIGQKLASHWGRQNIALNPGVSEEDLADFQARYGVCIPKDVASLFLVVNGMSGSQTDDDLIRFWPLEEVRPLSEEAPTLVNPRDPECGRSLFVFADYSIWAYAYAITLTRAAGENPVFRVVDIEPDKIASSFAEFTDLYLGGNLAIA